MSRIVEEAVAPDYREIAENPLLCMLLLHVLVLHAPDALAALLRLLFAMLLLLNGLKLQVPRR